ncbi:glycosyltransferase family 4 protein [Salinibacter grassmerensis]|uniref:glycosyltransferase family 4 protein n=1 Tax=Salinibacter grassmerensis TaxID=3040353 RepID=UPI0021E7EDE6|nr:glycosyltransferase family 4 protein [Salinibacter grassmerensis]
MEKKHLALVCQHFYPEMVSTGMHMTELARRLRKHGWGITVYCAQPALEEGEEEVPTIMTHQGIRIKRMPTVGDQRESTVSRLFLAFTYVASTTRALIQDRDEYDGLLVTTNPPFIGLAGWFASKVLGKPYVQLVYDVYPDIAEQLGVIAENGVLSGLWEQMTRLILNEATSTVVIGRDMAELVQKKMRRKNYGSMQLIPNWSDETVVEPVPRNENPFRRENDVGDRMLVQYAGRHGKTHNLEPLIEAASQLTDRPVLLQFIGGGDKKEKLQRMAEERSLENVMFLPYQPMEKLDTVLAAADIAVVCLESRFTGMSVPSKTYGIMASGTPLLGLLDKESEIGRTIQENDCGYVLEDPSGTEVAQSLETLLNEPDLLEGMGTRGREAFEANFTLSAAAERYDAVLSRYIYGREPNDMRPVPERG